MALSDITQPHKVRDPHLNGLARLASEHEHNPIPECALVPPEELRFLRKRVADLEGQNDDLRETVKLLRGEVVDAKARGQAAFCQLRQLRTVAGKLFRALFMAYPVVKNHTYPDLVPVDRELLDATKDALDSVRLVLPLP